MSKATVIYRTWRGIARVKNNDTMKKSNELKLGTIPTGNETRDAVHIAIVPVKAAELLLAGMRVKLNSKGEAVPSEDRDSVGVVDPFLTGGYASVEEGCWFWLCLLPGSITSLAHVWEHPRFPLSGKAPSESEPAGDIAKSKAWITDYVREHCPDWGDEGYFEFLRHVTDYKWIFYNGTDCHCLEDVEDADELFWHLSVVLNQRIDASYFEAFTCTC